MKNFCACGCGEIIEIKPHHKYRQIRFKPGHFQKTGASQLGKRTSLKRVQPGTKCACGCGEEVPEFNSKGIPQYSRRKDKGFFLRGHAGWPKAEKSHKFRTGRVIDKQGHILLLMHGHHLADKSGYVAEHRLIWEEVNNRLLNPKEHVHHINGDPADNRPENLVALTNSEHGKVHGRNPNSFATKEQLRQAQCKATEARIHNKN